MAGPIEATVRINADKLDMRVRDLELAVGELANLVERLIIAEPKRWKGEERKAMLFAVDNARALATPEDGDDDPEPEPPTVISRYPAARYAIDLKGGNQALTDSLAEVASALASGRALNVYDHERRELIAWNGEVDGFSDSAAELRAAFAEAA